MLVHRRCLQTRLSYDKIFIEKIEVTVLLIKMNKEESEDISAKRDLSTKRDILIGSKWFFIVEVLEQIIQSRI